MRPGPPASFPLALMLFLLSVLKFLSTTKRTNPVRIIGCDLSPSLSSLHSSPPPPPPTPTFSLLCMHNPHRHGSRGVSVCTTSAAFYLAILVNVLDMSHCNPGQRYLLKWGEVLGSPHSIPHGLGSHIQSNNLFAGSEWHASPSVLASPASPSP